MEHAILEATNCTQGKLRLHLMNQTRLAHGVPHKSGGSPLVMSHEDVHCESRLTCSR